MTSKLLFLCGLFTLLQLSHGAPSLSSSKEVDVVVVPRLKLPPIVIFEYKEHDVDDDTTDSGEEDNSTSTTSELLDTTTHLILTHLKTTHDSSVEKNADFSTSSTNNPAKSELSGGENDSNDFEVTHNDSSLHNTPRSDGELKRSRRDAVAQKVNGSHTFVNQDDEHNEPSSSTPGLNSDEVIFASSEDDNGVIFTRISIFRLVRVSYNETNATSSEEPQETSTESFSTTSAPIYPSLTTLQDDPASIIQRKKRQAGGGYGAIEVEPSNGRSDQNPPAPESLTLSVTAPTYIDSSSSPPTAASATASATTIPVITSQSAAAHASSAPVSATSPALVSSAPVASSAPSAAPASPPSVPSIQQPPSTQTAVPSSASATTPAPQTSSAPMPAPSSQPSAASSSELSIVAPAQASLPPTASPHAVPAPEAISHPPATVPPSLILCKPPPASATTPVIPPPPPPGREARSGPIGY